MSNILRDVAAPAFQAMGVHYLIDPECGGLVVPFATSDGGRLLLHLDADDEIEEAVLSCVVGQVRPARRGAVGLLLAELSAEYRFVSFALSGDLIVANMAIELAHTTDAAALIGLGFERLTRALEDEHPRIARALRRRPRRSLVEREVDAILDQLGFTGS